MDFFHVEAEPGLHANGREFSSPVGPSNGIGANPQQLSQFLDRNALVVGRPLHVLLRGQGFMEQRDSSAARGERSGLTQERKLGRKGQERPLEVRSGQNEREILALTKERLRGETREGHNWIDSAYLMRVRKIEKRGNVP
jgi:hypothetical protein